MIQLVAKQQCNPFISRSLTIGFADTSQLYHGFLMEVVLHHLGLRLPRYSLLITFLSSVQEPVYSTQYKRHLQNYEYFLTSIVLIFTYNVLKWAEMTKFVTLASDFVFRVDCKYNFSTPVGNTQLTWGRLGATSSLCARGSEWNAFLSKTQVIFARPSN